MAHNVIVIPLINNAHDESQARIAHRADSLAKARKWAHSPEAQASYTLGAKVEVGSNDEFEVVAGPFVLRPIVAEAPKVEPGPAPEPTPTMASTDGPAMLFTGDMTGAEPVPS